jgi:hypothetical protein
MSEYQVPPSISKRMVSTDSFEACLAYNVGARTGGLGVVYLLTQLCELKSNMEQR